MDTEAYMQNLLVSHSMREPILQSAVRALELPIGSSGLDAGCGIGLPALLLSDEVGPNGHVMMIPLTGFGVPTVSDMARGILYLS